MALINKVDNIVIVSSIYDDEDILLDEGTLNYLKALELVNDRLASIADKVVKLN